MACCKNKPCQYIFFVGATLIALLGLVMGLLWSSIATKILQAELVLKVGSQNYNSWIKTPIPIYFEIFLFNWTNAEEYRNADVRPHFQECGPYVFREVHERVDLDWHNNATVSFNQIRTWYYEEKMSNGSLDDVITNVNVISATAAYMVRNNPTVIKWFANFMLDEIGGSVHVTKTVRELLYDGYDDPLLDFLRGVNSTKFNIPFKKFGWFVERNESKTYDGRWNINTGADNIKKLGLVNLWNREARSPHYRDYCGMINGTTGEVWPPIDVSQAITVFASDVCRSITVVPESSYEKFGIEGQKWVGDEHVFDGGVNFADTKCFCTSAPEKCPDMPYGVMNVSDCKFGAPAFVSYPHFYLASEEYLKPIDGLSPSKKEHEFSVALEPSTGIPLQIRAQLQINIHLEPITHIKLYQDVPNLMVPALWFRQLAAIDEKLAGDAKVGLALPQIGVYVAIGIGLVGVILFIVAVTLMATGYWKKEDEMNSPLTNANASSMPDNLDS